MRTCTAILALLLVSIQSAAAAGVLALAFSVSGTVEYSPRGSSTFHPVKKGDRLPLGSVVRTGDDGLAILVTTPGTAVQIGNDSVMRLNHIAYSKSPAGMLTERKVRLQLLSGVVTALIDPSTPKITDFQIQTPEGVTAARGTFYAVYVEQGKMYVGVKEGRVATSRHR
jgi:hypothetical protein